MEQARTNNQNTLTQVGIVGTVVVTRQDGLPGGALAVPVLGFAGRKLGLFRVEACLDDVVGRAPARGLGSRGRGEDGDGEEECRFHLVAL